MRDVEKELEDIKKVKKLSKRTAIIQQLELELRKLKRLTKEERRLAAACNYQRGLIAQGYNEMFSMLAIYGLKFGRNMLEVGFGLGTSFGFFKDFNYYGTEASERCLYAVKQVDIPNGFQLRRAAKRLNLDDQAIDFVLAVNSISYIEDWRRELDECHRVVRSQGAITIVQREDVEELNLPNLNGVDKNRPQELADYLTQKGMLVTVERFLATYFGEVISPACYFGFTHVKATKP